MRSRESGRALEAVASTASDYVFANGRRIARAEGLDRGLHSFGTKNGASQWAINYFGSAAGLANYTIQPYDTLYFTQYQNAGSKGGVVLNFTDGTSSNWSVKDQEGYYLNDDQTQAATHLRIVNLNSLAGKIISKIGLNQETDTTNGAWGIIYEQISLVSSDGTVHPIYTGQTSSPITSTTQSGGETGIGSQIDTNRNHATLPSQTTTYYIADHLGSSRLLASGNGYPIWSGVFLPYGQEWNPQMTTNKYKFTGAERDSESNLDHAQFRQYEGTEGRWVSPDPSGIAAADLTDPQSLNMYSYVLNNPVLASDPTGLKMCPDWLCGWGGGDGGGDGFGGGGDFGGGDPGCFQEPCGWGPTAHCTIGNICIPNDPIGIIGPIIIVAGGGGSGSHPTGGGGTGTGTGGGTGGGTTSTGNSGGGTPGGLDDAHIGGSGQPPLTGETLGLPTGLNLPSNPLGAFLPGNSGCEFGACNFLGGAIGAHYPVLPPQVLNSIFVLSWVVQQTTKVHGPWTHGNWCGEGGSGVPVDSHDTNCLFHDYCYYQNQLTFGDNRRNLPLGQAAALQGCNQALCNSESQLGGVTAWQITNFFKTEPFAANRCQ